MLLPTHLQKKPKHNYSKKDCRVFTRQFLFVKYFLRDK